MELLAALSAIICGGVGGGEKEYRNGGDEEMVVEDLDAAVNLAFLVEEAEVLDGLFGEVHDELRVLAVLHHACVRVEDRGVQPDANLVWLSACVEGGLATHLDLLT